MFQFNLPGSRPSPHTQFGLNGLNALWQRLMPLARRNTAARALEHLESLPLTTQSSVALIRMHDETLLLGITPHNITLLAKTPRGPEPTPAEGELER